MGGELQSMIPPALAAAMRAHRLVIFAGAGISMLPPASLPDWAQFNEALLAEAKAAALRVRTLDSAAENAVAGLQLADIGMQIFSEAIVKIIAGYAYFPVLQALDGDQPNANHFAIADLIKRGSVAAVVTTNFDTLLERACALLKVPLRVALTADDYHAPADDLCTLYKIHGSITDSTTLVDTVGQKTRGLAPHVRLRLADLFSNNHVLVLGYSGMDLDFGSDYLSFASIDINRHGITWLAQPAKEPGQKPQVALRVQEILQRAQSNGELVAGSLPTFLEGLGAAPSKAPAIDDVEARARADARVRDTSRAFFDSMDPRNALALCLRLVAVTGRLDEARAMYAVLARDLAAFGDVVPPGTGPALRALVVVAPMLEGVNAQEKWLRRELTYLEAQQKVWEAKVADVGKKKGRAGEQLPVSQPYPFYDLQAGAWTNMANYLTHTGDFASAGKALERSLDYCELSASGIALAHMFFAYAHWCRARGYLDSCLGFYMAAEAAGITFGNLDAANASAFHRAETLIWLGEYDAALAGLERIRGRLPLAPARDLEQAVTEFESEIKDRRAGVDFYAAQKFSGTVPQSSDPAHQEEFDLRRVLVEAEYHRDHETVLNCLRMLTVAAHESGSGERAVELAEAFLSGALRAQNFEMQVSAHWMLGNTRYALGDADGAREAFTQLLRIELAGDPTFAVRVRQWLHAIATGNVPPAAGILVLMRIIAGNGREPRSASTIEQQARRALAAQEIGPARIWLMEAIDAYRRQTDFAAVERCYGLLADAAELEGRATQASALRTLGASLRVMAPN